MVQSADGNSIMRLFYSAGSPCARIVRIALQEADLDRRVTKTEVTRARLYSSESEVLTVNTLLGIVAGKRLATCSRTLVRRGTARVSSGFRLSPAGTPQGSIAGSVKGHRCGERLSGHAGLGRDTVCRTRRPVTPRSTSTLARSLHLELLECRVF
jgi:hypothetical protein